MDKFNSAKDGRKVVVSAGVREQISGGLGIPCRKIDIMALKTNTSGIAVGGNTVVASGAAVRGIPLDPGQSTTIYIHNLNKLWMDVEKSGEGASFMYFD